MDKVNKKQRFSGDMGESTFGIYLKDISRIPLLTPEDEERIALLASQGNKAAQDKLVRSNLRFVVSMAKRYQGQGLPLEDLVNEGNLGLISASSRFDPERGFRFVIYAAWWIRQSILKAISEKSRNIRLPLNRVGEILRIDRIRQSSSENATSSEIADIAGKLGMAPERVAYLLTIGRDMVSLESPAYQDGDEGCLADRIEDTSYGTPYETLVTTLLREDIDSVLRTLDDKEATIIRKRYGLNGYSPMSLWEIGNEYNLTKERIRQIEKKALTRLQHPARMSVLENYVA
jgi:RNA polymerase primary sigma factor